MRDSQSVSQPLTPLPIQHWQGLREVRCILWAMPFGFVEQLNLGRQTRDTICGDASDGGQRAPYGWNAAKEPLIIVAISDHELQRPWLSGRGATPDIVDRHIQLLTAAQGAKWPQFIARWLERGLHVPSVKQCANYLLIASEYLHIDVSMLARLLPQKEIYRPTSSYPPGSRERSKKRRYIVRTPGLPALP